MFCQHSMEAAYAYWDASALIHVPLAFKSSYMYDILSKLTAVVWFCLICLCVSMCVRRRTVMRWSCVSCVGSACPASTSTWRRVTRAVVAVPIVRVTAAMALMLTAGLEGSVEVEIPIICSVAAAERNTLTWRARSKDHCLRGEN